MYTTPKKRPRALATFSLVIRHLHRRLFESLGWRWRNLCAKSHAIQWIKLRQRRTVGFIHARWGWAWRRLKYPLPWLAPYRRKRIVVARHFGLGDVLMCTPGLRQLKELNPDCHVTFYSPFSQYLKGLPYIDAVAPYDPKILPKETIRYWVEDSVPPWRHISAMMADFLGVRLRETRPDCVVDFQLVERFCRSWAELPRPWVLLNRYSSGYTTNKDWFDDRWEALIERLLKRGTVIEVGNKPISGKIIETRNYVDLRNRTGLDELAAAIRAADLFVSPVSGPVHIAAALGLRGVVIYGGYEKPVCSEYAGNINLCTPLPCSPCFLNHPCPIDRECMKRISVKAVEDAVERLWARGVQERTRPKSVDL